MSAVMLPPGELAIQQAHVYGGHFLSVIVVRSAQAFRAQQPEHGLRGDGGHEAALMIEPLDCSSITRYDIT